MENISVFVRSCSFTGKTNNVLQLFFVSGIIGNSIHNIVVDMDDIRATVWLVGALTLRIQERRFSVIAVEKCDLFDVSFHAVGVHATVTMDLGDQERRHVGDPTLLNVTAWLLRSQIVYVYSSNIVGCFIQVLRCELLFQGVNGLITVPPFSMSTVATAALIFVELISLTIVNIVRGDVTLQRSIVNAFINVTIDSPSSAQVLVIAAQVDGMTVVASVMNASITISDNVSVLAPTLLVASSSSSSLSKAPIVTGIVLQSYLPSVVVSAMGGSVSSAWTRTTITIENGVFVCVSPAHSTSPLSVALVGIPKSISGGTSYILSNTSISILGDIQEDCSTPLECVPVVVILVSDTTLFAGCSSLLISGQLGCVQSFASMSSSVVASSYALQFASQSRFHVKSVVATIALAGCGPSGCFLFNCSIAVYDNESFIAIVASRFSDSVTSVSSSSGGLLLIANASTLHSSSTPTTSAVFIISTCGVTEIVSQDDTTKQSSFIGSLWNGVRMQCASLGVHAPLLLVASSSAAPADDGPEECDDSLCSSPSATIVPVAQSEDEVATAVEASSGAWWSSMGAAESDRAAP